MVEVRGFGKWVGGGKRRFLLVCICLHRTKKDRKSFYINDFRSFLKLLKQISGGEGEIRTLGTLLTYTRFPIVLLRPARTPLRLESQFLRQKIAGGKSFSQSFLIFFCHARGVGFYDILFRLGCAVFSSLQTEGLKGRHSGPLPGAGSIAQSPTEGHRQNHHCQNQYRCKHPWPPLRIPLLPGCLFTVFPYRCRCPERCLFRTAVPAQACPSAGRRE